MESKMSNKLTMKNLQFNILVQHKDNTFSASKTPLFNTPLS